MMEQINISDDFEEDEIQVVVIMNFVIELLQREHSKHFRLIMP
jgi:hypothetical protein